jgi:small-conductance mechanosensitive channel
LIAFFFRCFKPLNDPDLAQMLAKAASIGVYGLGGITIAGTLGVDTVPLMTGLGVTGLGVTFAAKNVLTDYVDGLTLALDKPFAKGQYIIMRGALDGKGLEGVVESFSWKYVVVRSSEHGVTFIPSKFFFSNPVEVLPDVPADRKAPHKHQMMDPPQFSHLHYHP